MERGTDRERRAVRERWATLEQKRESVTRLLGGTTLAIAGVILLLLAVARDVCFTTMRGGTIACTPMTRAPAAVALSLLGVAALGAGLWIGWTAIRD